MEYYSGQKRDQMCSSHLCFLCVVNERKGARKVELICAIPGRKDVLQPCTRARAGIALLDLIVLNTCNENRLTAYCISRRQLH